ncbi:hypothetical protein CLU79DRAFT_367040 [Phycomyces nitens]|nr:hypothetical protein CLU79DRAFT_367040 [Phycomyces nitens]
MTQKHPELPSFDFQLWLPSQVDTLGSFSDDLIKQFDSKSFVIKSQVMDAIQHVEDRQSPVTPTPYRDDLATTVMATIDREEAEDTEWVDPKGALKEEWAQNMATREEDPLVIVDRGLHKILKDTSESFLGSIGSADNAPVELDRHAYSEEADSTLSSIYSADPEDREPDQFEDTLSLEATKQHTTTINNPTTAQNTLVVPRASAGAPGREFGSIGVSATLVTIATAEQYEEEEMVRNEETGHSTVTESLLPSTVSPSPASSLLPTPPAEEMSSKGLLHKSSAFFRQKMTKFKKGHDSNGHPPMPRNIFSSFSLSHDKNGTRQYPPKPLQYSPVDPPSDDMSHRKSLPLPSKSRTMDSRTEDRRRSEPQPTVSKQRRSFFSQLLHRGTA